MVRIEGKKYPDELVLLGSHLDSIAGWYSSGDAPGADDNASNTATNMSVLKTSWIITYISIEQLKFTPMQQKKSALSVVWTWLESIKDKINVVMAKTMNLYSNG